MSPPARGRRGGVPTDGARPADDVLPASENKTAHVRSMFDRIAPRYDLVNKVITLGLDQRWRRLTTSSLGLPTGSVVLDLACGTGDLARIASSRGHRTVGIDLSWGMLDVRHPGIHVVQSDVLRLPFADGAFDGVVCGYAFRNFTDLPSSLAETARVLRPGGRLAALEVAQPCGSLLRAGHRIWFEHAVPAIGGILSDRAAYRYLPRSTAYLPNQAVLRAALRESGFSAVGCRMLSGGLSQIVTATRIGLPTP